MRASKGMLKAGARLGSNVRALWVGLTGAVEAGCGSIMGVTAGVSNGVWYAVEAEEGGRLSGPPPASEVSLI